MSYLSEPSYLEGTVPTQMNLPDELIQKLSGPPAVPEDYINLPVLGPMKKQTALLLLAVAVVLFIWYVKTKRKPRTERT